MSVYGGGGLSGGDLWDPLETGGETSTDFLLQSWGKTGGGGLVSGETKRKGKVCSQPTCFPPPLFLL